MNTLAPGLADLRSAWKRRQLALYFAWTETLARYRRSVLGPLWLVFSTVIGVVGLGFVWSTLLQVQQREFIPSLTVGLVTWQLISGSIVEATGLFPNNSSLILNIKLPTFLISLQLLFRHLINYAHNLIVIAVVLVVYPEHLTPMVLLAVPGMAIVAASLFGAIQILGFLGARYRDLGPLVGAFMPILFFLSPVIYQSRQLGQAQFIMEFNPLAHWIRLVRDPVLGFAPGPDSYAIGLAIMAGIWLLAVWVTSARGHRLPYWV